ncbi:hypothetical protein HZA86_04290 [Candidatus Uhrbacteria bacterium]|nr:hypothetical protein [Candidatus Uhrbacteria bacterium]
MFDIALRLAALGFVLLLACIAVYVLFRTYSWLADQRRRTWFVGGLLVSDVALMLFGATGPFWAALFRSLCVAAPAAATGVTPGWGVVDLMVALDVMMALCAIAVIPMVIGGYFAIEADRAVVTPAP